MAKTTRRNPKIRDKVNEALERVANQAMAALTSSRRSPLIFSARQMSSGAHSLMKRKHTIRWVSSRMVSKYWRTSSARACLCR